MLAGPRARSGPAPHACRERASRACAIIPPLARADPASGCRDPKSPWVIPLVVPKARGAPSSPLRSSSARKSAARSPGEVLDRRLDILGFLLVALGAYSFIGLIAAEPGSFTYSATFLLRQGVGWGAYLLPAAVLAVGAWLILRQFREELPSPSTSRLAGGVLLYLDLLAVLHALLGPSDIASALAIGHEGRGGGYLGGLLLMGLVRMFDWAGAILVLGAWFLVGFILAARVSLAELLRRGYNLAARGWQQVAGLAHRAIASRELAGRSSPPSTLAETAAGRASARGECGAESGIKRSGT